MSGLIERARLTDEEIDALPMRIVHNVSPEMQCEDVSHRDVADAATAKALWACAEWLRASRYETIRWEGGNVVGMLELAGIERPGVPVENSDAVDAPTAEEMATLGD